MPFTQEFLDRVDPTWEDARSYPAHVLKLTEEGAESYSASYWEEPLHDLKPLWAWGVFPYWDAVGEVWMLFDKSAAGHAFEIVREARIVLDRLEKPPWSFKRIFGQFDTRVTQNYKLAHLTGFYREGLLRNFGVGGEQDFSVYARVN